MQALETTVFDERVKWLLEHDVTQIRFPVPSANSEWMEATIDGDWTQSHSLTLNASWTYGPVLSVHAEAAPLNVAVFTGNITHAQLNPLFVKLFALVNGAILRHLESKGWLKYIVAEFVDEPHFNASEGELSRTLLKSYSTEQLNNFTRCAVTNVAKLWKALHPDLRLQQTVDDPATLQDLEMRRLVDVWIVNNQAYGAAGVPGSLAQLRRERPSVITMFYHNAIPVVDLPVRNSHFNQ